MQRWLGGGCRKIKVAKRMDPARRKAQDYFLKFPQALINFPQFKPNILCILMNG